MLGDEMQGRSPIDDRVPWMLPLLLSIVAGYVDACTYLGLFGIFVAQATGSFVLVGLELMTRERGAIAKLLAVPSFVLAGMAVTLLGSLMKARPRIAFAASLLLESALLIGFMLSWLLAQPFHGPDDPSALVALILAMTAMGAQSAAVHLLLRGIPSTNVMTTNSTMFAINAVELLLALKTGGNADQRTKSRSELFTLLRIGLGFLVGVVLGALAFMTLGLTCVVLAIVPIFAIAAWCLMRADDSIDGEKSGLRATAP